MDARRERRRGAAGIWPLGALLWPAALLLALGALAGCKDDAAKPDENQPPPVRYPQDFLPASVGDMTPQGTPTLATTANELQQEEEIDGHYQVFVAYSFQKFAGQSYLGTVGGQETTAKVWIFEMDTAQHAQDLFWDENNLCGNSLDVGEEGRLCTTSVGTGSATVQFWRDVYWARVVLLNGSEDAQRVAGLFATDIDTQISDYVQP